MKFIKTYENLENPIIAYWDNGNMRSKKYYFGVKKHREKGPAVTMWYENGQKESQKYYIKGKLHRENGPAVIWWNKNGKDGYMLYYLNGIDYSREDFVQKLKDINSPHYENELLKYNASKYNL